VTSGNGTQRTWDAMNRRSPDSFPCCPHCGNLCGKLARLCADCGSFLYEPNAGDRFIRAMLHAAPKGEDTTPTKGMED
jgi:predicted amidophosphoribosyltransferase